MRGKATALWALMNRPFRLLITILGAESKTGDLRENSRLRPSGFVVEGGRISIADGVLGARGDLFSLSSETEEGLAS
jgi:hypothetical protein